MNSVKVSITVEGNQDQITEFFTKIAPILPQGSVEQFTLKPSPPKDETEVEERDYSEVFERIGWETFYLAHLVLAHQEGKDQRGVYVSVNKLLDLPINENGNSLLRKQISSRVGAAKRISTDLHLDSMMDFVKTKITGERRLYLFDRCIDQFQEYLDEVGDTYREWLEGEGLNYPEMAE